MKEYTQADRIRQFRVALQALAKEREVHLITFQEYCLRGAELARIYLGATSEDTTP